MTHFCILIYHSSSVMFKFLRFLKNLFVLIRAIRVNFTTRNPLLHPNPNPLRVRAKFGCIHTLDGGYTVGEIALL